MLDEDQVGQWVQDRFAQEMAGYEEARDYLLSVFQKQGDGSLATLDYIADGREHRQTVAKRGTLGELAMLAKRLSDSYRWRPSEAATFVLTGRIPEIQVYVGSAEIRHHEDSALTRVTLTLDPALAPEQVMGIYIRLRSRLRTGGAPRTLSPKTYCLAGHVGPHIKIYAARPVDTTLISVLTGRPWSRCRTGTLVAARQSRACGRLIAMTDDPTWADDDEEHNEGPAGDAAPGLAVTALAGGVGAAAGYYAGGPGGAAFATAATPYLAVFFQKAVNALWTDRTRRAEKMMQTAAETSGLPPEQFAERASESEQARFLTEKAIQAAADTIWPQGVRAIGRALAAGLLAKDKPVMDIRQRVLGVMQNLDELHVSLLELLVRYEPEARHDGLVAIPHRFPSHVNTFLGGDRPDNPKVWSVGRRTWTARQICAVRPQFRPVLTSLLGELRESGLAQDNDTAPDAIEQLSDDLTKQVNRQAGQMQRGQQIKPITLQQTTIRLTEPTWSPTELGEKILAFFAEAGTEDGQG